MSFAYIRAKGNEETRFELIFKIVAKKRFFFWHFFFSYLRSSKNEIISHAIKNDRAKKRVVRQIQAPECFQPYKVIYGICITNWKYQTKKKLEEKKEIAEKGESNSFFFI